MSRSNNLEYIRRQAKTQLNKLLKDPKVSRVKLETILFGVLMSDMRSTPDHELTKSILAFLLKSTPEESDSTERPQTIADDLRARFSGGKNGNASTAAATTIAAGDQRGN